MRTLYQASPWKADASPVVHSFAFDRHAPQRLGDPSAFFSRAPFIPTRPVGAPIMGSSSKALALANDRTSYEPSLGVGDGSVEGIDVTRPICRCHFAGEGSQLGQAGCSKPTAGGSGSAEFGAGDGGHAGDSNIGTIVVAGAVGVGILFLLGII